MKKLIFTLFIAVAPLLLLAQTQRSGPFAPDDEHEVVIYPNPVFEDDMHIKSEDIASVEIMNVIGRKIYTKKVKDRHHKEVIVPVDPFDKGLYLVKVTFRDKKAVIQKVLIK